MSAKPNDPSLSTTENLWMSWDYLRESLRVRVSAADWGSFESALSDFASAVQTKAVPLSELIHRNPPKLHSYDGWGAPIDQIDMHPALDSLGRFACRNELFALPLQILENRFQDRSLLFQFSKIALFHSSAASVTHAIAMNDMGSLIFKFFAPDRSRSSATTQISTLDPSTLMTCTIWPIGFQRSRPLSTVDLSIEAAEGLECTLNGRLTQVLGIEAHFALIWKSKPDHLQHQFYFVPLQMGPPDVSGIHIERLSECFGPSSLTLTDLKFTNLNVTALKPLSVNPPLEHEVSVALLQRSFLHQLAWSAGTAAQCLAELEAHHQREERRLEKRSQSEPSLEPQSKSHIVQNFASLKSHLAAITELFAETLLLTGKREAGRATPQDDLRLNILIPIAALYLKEQAHMITSTALTLAGTAASDRNNPLNRLYVDQTLLGVLQEHQIFQPEDFLRELRRDGVFLSLFSDLQERLRLVPQGLTRGRVERRLATLSHTYRKLMAVPDATALYSIQEFSRVLAETTAAVLLLERSVRSELYRLASSRFINEIGEWIPSGDDVGKLTESEINDLAFGHPLI